MPRKERLKEEELLPKGLWDLLPAEPPYPPLPRTIARGIFGRKFKEKGEISEILPEPPWKE